MIDMNGITGKTITLSAILIASSCSSEDTALKPPIGDISGTWAMNEQSNSSNTSCVETLSYSLEVTQNQNDVVATGSSDRVLQGKLSGDILTGTGSFSRAGGITTITSSTAVIAADCSSLTAESAWTWTNGSTSCTGTTKSTGVRTSGNGSCN